MTFNAEEGHAVVWTCWPPMLRKFAKAGITPMRNDGQGKAFKIPKKWITIRTKQVKNNMTDVQRKASSERLLKARQDRILGEKRA